MLALFRKDALSGAESQSWNGFEIVWNRIRQEASDDAEAAKLRELFLARNEAQAVELRELYVNMERRLDCVMEDVARGRGTAAGGPCLAGAVHDSEEARASERAFSARVL